MLVYSDDKVPNEKGEFALGHLWQMEGDIPSRSNLLVVRLDTAIVFVILEEKNAPILTRTQLQVFEERVLLDRVDYKVDEGFSVIKVGLICVNNDLMEARVDDLAAKLLKSV